MAAKTRTRIVTVCLALLALLVGVIAPASFTSSAAHADVNDFTIESFDATYTLSRDGEGRSSLHTVEHIVAVFPDFDQNRGLIRDLTRVYDGHDTNVQVLSVTDETGAARSYTTEPYGDFLAVTMAVPEGQYLHGAQHYVIEYTQRDVTRFFDDTGVDEFYWDINGTDWSQPFDQVSAEIYLSPELAASLTGATACYRGAFGSTDRCSINDASQQSDSAAENSTPENDATEDGAAANDEAANSEAQLAFTIDEQRIASRENVSFAIAFAPGTFTAAPTPPAPPTPFLQKFPLLIWGGIASFLAGIAAFVTALVRGRKAKTGRAIIAMYEPPEGISVALAAELLRTPNKAMTATLLDFAVRRKLRLLYHAETKQYGVQAVDPTGLLPIEVPTYNRVLSGSSGTDIDPGTTHWFSRTSTRLGDPANSLKARAKAEATKQDLVKKASGKSVGTVILLFVLALGLPVLHAIIFDQFVLMTILLAVGVNVLIWGSIAIVLILAKMQRPTYQGALLLDHLKGLREYIRLAEADRIRMLQSASGAEVNEQFIVQVYERLLPYAVLFGFEKEWQGELARYYRESTPDWVYGTEGQSFTTGLSLSAFSNTVSSAPVTQAVSSSSGSGSGGSFSSFSGGSSGGGFSGGGGGGGGGRGI
ncbi:MAG: DUF2207 domain-containing protein [Leucobacter sp.]|nr:DUF2207 domain-containing protein [Leucobacter sp.]